MIQLQIYDAIKKPTELEKKSIVQFLHTHLEQYGDAPQDIQKAIEYATKEKISFGGFIVIAKVKHEIVGTVVINKTGMDGYIPENILVYIATHGGHRGKGIGKQLMEQTIQFAKGDIALHVEASNPAKKLYESYGFTNPYLEMRLKRS